ncbi:MAG: alpha/beta fold hydrolase [Proteobacteria bacterium]|nr:MAG: alpha/beta fold hydrolase [Pseudomonadota bacterium]
MEKKAQLPRSEGLRRKWLETLLKKGFSLDEGHFSRSSGGESAYLLIQPKANSQLTILFHGTGNDQLFTWQKMIEALLSKGRSVLTFDLDGHGYASSTLLYRKKFWESAEDLRAFLSSKGLSDYPYELVGYSLGALLALEAASQQTLRPTKIVLIALPLRIKIGLRFASLEAFSITKRSFFQQWANYGWRETFPAVGPIRRKSFPLRIDSDFEGAYPQMVDQLLRDKPPLELLTKLSQNCLAVFGSRDTLARAEDSSLWRNADKDRGRDKGLEIVVIDRANHFLLPFQRQTIDAITTWIDT